jgi:hypothetical protein
MKYLIVGAVVASIPDIMEELEDQTKVVFALFVTDTFYIGGKMGGVCLELSHPPIPPPLFSS